MNYFNLLIVFLVLSGCKGQNYDYQLAEQKPDNKLSDDIGSELINRNGNTISTRILVPEGYVRLQTSENSFQHYLQHYTLKVYGSKIYTYTGEEFWAQDWHQGILDLDVPSNGLQQCADALIRMRSEFLWQQNRPSEIGFEFTSGHYCSWLDYAKGYRPNIKGNKVSFHKTKPENHSESNFYNYLNLIFNYSGTLSLYNELEKIPLSEVTIGDMLVDPGTPGHINIIVDQAVDGKGNKIFAMVQGYTPAQSVCLLKNTVESSISPWYRFSEKQPVATPGYYFEEPIFIRFK